MARRPFQPPKAFRNKAFLDSADARPIRILSEYLEPLERFEDLAIEDTILFFGSARILSREEAEAALQAAEGAGGDVERARMRVEMSRYYEATRQLAYRLTAWSKELRDEGRRFVICSGGGPGIMEAANRGASEAGGANVGLGIALPLEQFGNPYITRRLAFQFHYFFMRKFWFLYLAKALILMPGGFGTLDELFEALTLLQTKKMKKRLPIVLFGVDYWDKVVNLEAMAEFGTISPSDLDLLFRTDSVDEAFKYVTEELTGYALQRPGVYL